MQTDVQYYAVPDGQTKTLIEVLLAKIDEAVAFAEAVLEADITYADVDAIRDHLASLDMAQISVVRPS